MYLRLQEKTIILVSYDVQLLSYNGIFIKEFAYLIICGPRVRLSVLWSVLYSYNKFMALTIHAVFEKRQ